jgi:hypothetical protein
LLRRGPLNVRGAAPSIWLEAQYGWVPLLSDIHTGIGQFYERVESGYNIRAKGGGAQTITSGLPYSAQVGLLIPRDVTVTRLYHRYILEYQVDHTNLANMDDWGITNPLLLAWELVPYSFVVDWFYPVGNWLSQVGYSLGLHFSRGMRTGLCKAITTRNYRPPPPAGEYSYEASGMDVFETIRFRREILAGWPSPVTPQIDKDGLRGKRITNALSLLALAFDRKAKPYRPGIIQP